LAYLDGAILHQGDGRRFEEIAAGRKAPAAA
jgi:hypothetical protein